MVGRQGIAVLHQPLRAPLRLYEAPLWFFFFCSEGSCIPKESNLHNWKISITFTNREATSITLHEEISVSGTLPDRVHPSIVSMATIPQDKILRWPVMSVLITSDPRSTCTDRDSSPTSDNWILISLSSEIQEPGVTDAYRCLI
ncbi:hypothetical protein TNCV_2286791 [Trichonephila clavipes]|nr:hypothetical protein TNCV_2286791 [Trichonephila clavipes]